MPAASRLRRPRLPGFRIIWQRIVDQVTEQQWRQQIEQRANQDRPEHQPYGRLRTCVGRDAPQQSPVDLWPIALLIKAHK